MLTAADDFAIHQTPEPIAYSGTDRNFYDRYWFNGYEPDGSLFFLAGMGVYPHLNIIDCGISIQVDGVEHCLRGSRVLPPDRHIPSRDTTAVWHRFEAAAVLLSGGKK